nr:hypothetical protein [Tanacetum cinerariifolium]
MSQEFRLGCGENLKKPSQAPKGVLVRSRWDLNQLNKLTDLFLQSLPPTLVEIRRMMWSLPKRLVIQIHLICFNSVKNDVYLGTNGRTSNLVSKEPNFSRLSFFNVESSSTSTTPIVDKIGKFEKLIIDWKVTLVDNEGEPVKKVDYPIDHDSDDEVASVDNDITRSMASEKPLPFGDDEKSMFIIAFNSPEGSSLGKDI